MKLNIKKLPLPVTNMMMISLTCYLLWHLLYSDLSIFKVKKLEYYKAQQLEKLNFIKKHNELLLTKIKLLNSKNLDLDILEEKAISKFNLKHKDEYILLTE